MKFEQFKSFEKPEGPSLESGPEKEERMAGAVTEEFRVIGQELEDSEKLEPAEAIKRKRRSAGLIGATVLATLFAMGAKEEALAQISVPMEHQAESIYSRVEDYKMRAEHHRLQQQLKEIETEKNSVNEDYEWGLITKKERDARLHALITEAERLNKEFEKQEKARWQRQKAIGSVISIISRGKGRLRF